MKNLRREFIKNASLITAGIGSGILKYLPPSELFKLRSEVNLRFIMASDSHYGQPDTPYDAMVETFIEKANLFHEAQVCDFCILNGDIIHDEGHLMPIAKTKYDNLKMPYYVTKGNHDMISDEAWQDIWKVPVNLTFDKGNNAFIIATTSDEKGTYLSPDLNWMKEKLEVKKGMKNIFVFVHIPQAKWTKHAIDTPEFIDLLTNYPNIKAVFYGHEHDQDGIMMHKGIPFIFDSHIGGSWGTDYKGFRVVEVLNDNTIITYMMNPTEALESSTI